MEMKSAMMQLFRLKARFIEMKIISSTLELGLNLNLAEIAVWEVALVALSHFPPRQYVSKDERRSVPSYMRMSIHSTPTETHASQMTPGIKTPARRPRRLPLFWQK